MRIKNVRYTTPRSKKLQSLDTIQLRDPIFTVAERIATQNCYPAGSNYTFARDGKLLNPEAVYGDTIKEGDRLALVIR